jgi:hypothetical protein
MVKDAARKLAAFFFRNNDRAKTVIDLALLPLGFEP